MGEDDLVRELHGGPRYLDDQNADREALKSPVPSGEWMLIVSQAHLCLRDRAVRAELIQRCAGAICGV